MNGLGHHDVPSFLVGSPPSLKSRACLAACAFFLGAGVPFAAQAQVNFSASFETSPFRTGTGDGPSDDGVWWVQQKAGTNRATSEPGIARDGVRALRLHTELGDINVAGSGLAERNDAALSQTTTDCFEGREHWWAHSIWFPADYRAPDPGGWGVAFDFHDSSNQCLPGEVCQANFHVDAMPKDAQAPDGRLRFRGYGGSTFAPVEYSAMISILQKEVWYDFVYHVRWSSGGTGFFDAWVNGEKKLTYRGPTLYAGQGCYLKLANYHTPFDPPPSQSSSILHDRVVRGATADDVRLTPLSPPSQGAYEETVGTYAGSQNAWSIEGSDVGTFSGGQIAASRVGGSTATFNFVGTALTWVGAKCNVCGIASVSIDGGMPATVDTAGPAGVGSLTSEAVFSVSGLAPGEHTIVINVTGTHSLGSSDNYIAVDGFNVSN